ncbi:MAG: hypothetical protein J6A80_00220 [Lachnospiraceae bacterium]|nr:hypothetical protein [Lachnospiraceae bacterium]
MIAILCNWIYVIFVSLGLGVGFSELSKKIFGYRIKRIDSLLMAGLAIATVYAQIFSLFTGVGMMANIVLFVCCILVYIFQGKNLKHCHFTSEERIKPEIIIVVAILVLLWAYFTSRGYMHYDSDLYHAQSIRWIEEYGVVPGLGNLHERFAYNSSFFALSALFSMKFLCGTSMHTMSGFFALVLSITALDIFKSWKNKKFLLTDYARVGLIYYLITIMDEVVSPASDYSIMCVIFFIVIKWLDLLEVSEKNTAPYALLCVLGVYALTLKLTAGLIILLVIKPLYHLIKEKKVKDTLIYLFTGLIVSIPWFVRTVIISGWLLYPFPALDLFEFDWEMNATGIELDAAQITTWGRALYDATLVELPITQWFPNWFKTTLSGTEKGLVLGCLICLIIYLFDFMMAVCKKRREQFDTLLVIGCILLSYSFWQCSAPLIRYGYAYVLLLDFLMLGQVLHRLGWNKMQNIVYFVLLLYGVYKVYAIGQYIYDTRLVHTYVKQADYGTYEMKSYNVGEYVFYYPASGDRSGYEFFPASTVKMDIELRGEGLEDGFRLRK